MEKSYLPTPKKSKKVKTESQIGKKQQSPQKDKNQPFQCVSYSQQTEEQTERNKPVLSRVVSHDANMSCPIGGGGDGVIIGESCDVTVEARLASVASRVTKMRPCNLDFVNDIPETNCYERTATDGKKKDFDKAHDLSKTLNYSSPSFDSSLSDDETSLGQKKLVLFKQRNKQLHRRADHVTESLKFCHNFEDVEVPSPWTGFISRKSKSIDRIECGRNVMDKYAYCPLNNDPHNDPDNDPDISPIYHELDPIDTRHSAIHTYQSIIELKEDLKALQANSETRNYASSSDIHLRDTTVELLSRPDDTTQPAATAVCLLPEKEPVQKNCKHFFFSKLRLPKRNASSRKQSDSVKGSGEVEKSKMITASVLSRSTKKAPSSLDDGSALSPTKFCTKSPITSSDDIGGSHSKRQNYDVCIPSSTSSTYYAHIKRQTCDGISLQQSPKKVHLTTFGKAPNRSNDKGKSFDLPINESFVSVNYLSRECGPSEVNLETACPSQPHNILQRNSNSSQIVSPMISVPLRKPQISESVRPRSRTNKSSDEHRASFDEDISLDIDSKAKEKKSFAHVSDNKSYSKKPEYLSFSHNIAKKIADSKRLMDIKKSQHGRELKLENSQAPLQLDLQRSTKRQSLVKALSFDSDLSSRHDSSERINVQWSGERRLTFASPSCGIRMAEMRAERRTSENKSPSPELKISTPPPSCLPRFFSSVQPCGASAIKNKKDASSQTFAKPTTPRPLGSSSSSSRMKMNTIVEEDQGVVVDEQTNKIDRNNITDKTLVTTGHKLAENYDLADCNKTSAKTAEQTTDSDWITASSIVTDLPVSSAATQADLHAVDIPVSVAENIRPVLDTLPTAVINENVNKTSGVVSNPSVESDLSRDNLSHESSSQTSETAQNTSSFDAASKSPKCELIARKKLNTTHLDYFEINFDSMNKVMSERKETATSLEDSVRDVVQKGSSSVSSRLKPPKPAKCMTSSTAVPPGSTDTPPLSPLPHEAHSSRLKNVSDQHRHLLRDVKTGVSEPPTRVVFNQFCSTVSSSIINDANAALTKPQTIIKRASVRNIESSGSDNIPTSTRDPSLDVKNKISNSEETVVTSSPIGISSNSSSSTSAAVGCSRWSLRPAQMPHSVAATTTARAGGSSFHNVPPVAAASRCVTDKKQLRLKSVSSPQTSPQRRRCSASSRNCPTDAAVPDGPQEIDSDCPQKTNTAIDSAMCSIASSIPQRSSTVRITAQPPLPPPTNDRSLSLSSSSTGSSTGSVVSAADSESEQCVFSYKKRLAVFERRDSALPTFRLNLISSDRENKTSATQLLTNKVLSQCSANDNKSFKYLSGSRPVRSRLLNLTPDREGFESLRLNETDESSSRPSSGKSYSEDERSDYASSTGN